MGVTESLSEEIYSAVIEELREFRRKIMNIAAHDQQPDRAYLIMFRSFHVQRNIKRIRKNKMNIFCKITGVVIACSLFGCAPSRLTGGSASEGEAKICGRVVYPSNYTISSSSSAKQRNQPAPPYFIR